MNVSLTPELERFVRQKVKSGMYTSASEVIREGLRWMALQDRRKAEQLAALRQEIERAQAQFDRGEGIEVKREEIGSYLEGIKDRAEAKAAKRRRKKKRA